MRSIYPSEWKVIELLDRMGSSTKEEVAEVHTEETGQKSETVKKALTHLNKRGLVEKSPHLLRPRKNDWALTEEGEEMVGEAKKRVKEIDEEGSWI